MAINITISIDLYRAKSQLSLLCIFFRLDLAFVISVLTPNTPAKLLVEQRLSALRVIEAIAYVSFSGSLSNSHNYDSDFFYSFCNLTNFLFAQPIYIA